MIGYLSGTLQHQEPQGNLDQIILNVSGVGYIVTCPGGVVACGLGERTEMWIHSITRDDGTKLYGFAEVSDVKGFVKMLDVQGVGAKVALALIGALGWQGLLAAISARDTAQLTRADGVGKKLAERIVHELSAKLAGLMGIVGGGAAMPSNIPVATSAAAESMSALTNLGYSGVAAQQAVQNVLQGDPSLTLEQIIPLALRSMSDQQAR